MKTDWSEVDQFRVQRIQGYESPIGATWGMFFFWFGSKCVRVIACDGTETDWEHVSVSVAIGKTQRTPTWDEMCFVKGKFWDEEESVIQFHPPKSEYVNNHAHCLHLWKCVSVEFPLPPSILIGIKGATMVS